MKLKDLFERYGNTVDVAVEYDLEYTTPDGDIEYRRLEIAGVVTVTKDAYGTGDSPTDYEFDVESITDTETGQAVPEQVIPKNDWEGIETSAIEKAQRHM